MHLTKHQFVSYCLCIKMKIYLQLALEIWREVIIEPTKEQLVAELLVEIKRFVNIGDNYTPLSLVSY